jgi:membrane-associated protein
VDHVTSWLAEAISSPWVYLVIFAVSLIDAFFPVVPGETSVITAGVFAASGQTDLMSVIGVAAVGALAGDHISYLLGRRIKVGRDSKVIRWAQEKVRIRGGLILVVARYIPGGRTAVTLTMGSVGYPVRRFTFFATIAAASWAVYSALIGYLGGMAFEKHPVKGLLFGLGLALSITLMTELARYVRKSRIDIPHA